MTENLHEVDWSKLPAPTDDGGADHLEGMQLPTTALLATNGSNINLAKLPGLSVIFAYPMTGRPDVALPEDWDMIPGARGCTPQACAFRDMEADLKIAGAEDVFGLSTQSSDYQIEAVERLHLPFPMLSDSELKLTTALNLPTMEVEGLTLIKRLTLIIQKGKVVRCFYPVFPPSESAQVVLNWLECPESEII